MKQVVDGLITSKHTLFKMKYKMLLQVPRSKTKWRGHFGPLEKNAEGTKYHVIPLHSIYKKGRPTEQRERYVQE